MTKAKQWAVACAAGLSLLAGSWGSAIAQQKELRIAYQPNPLQEASIDMMVKWGEKNNVKIIKVPNSYGVYVEKMTASLTSGSDQYDVIWHNDDWGQLWAHLVEPLDDVAGLKYAASGARIRSSSTTRTERPQWCRWVRPWAPFFTAPTWSRKVNCPRPGSNW